jgi:hypothetical protein
MSPICASESIPKEPAYLILGIPFLVSGFLANADLRELHISSWLDGIHFETTNRYPGFIPDIFRLSGIFTRTFYM